MEKVYYNPKTGYSGINELIRKTGKTKKEVEEFLQKQDTYTLHKPYRKPIRRKVYVDGIDDQFQIDLVDMQKLKYHNSHYNWILMIIDCFSKYGWAIPIKKKTGKDITTAFETFFKNQNRIP